MLRSESQARKSIVQEWDHWIKTQPLDGDACPRGGRRFFREIRAKRDPKLLDFGSSTDDKWALIRHCLVAEQRISD
jgi:hypothetical protein